jgi:hypothetical protein
MITISVGTLGLSVLAALLALFALVGVANAVLLWTFLKSWSKAFENSDVV